MLFLSIVDKAKQMFKKTIDKCINFIYNLKNEERRCYMEKLLKEKEKYLDIIYPHTEYKIKYIKAYVKLWLEVAINYRNTKNINFIDCMCNAGIYKNDVLGTPTEVLILFTEIAQNFPQIQFNLFVNDINKDRISIIKEVFNHCTKYKEINNIKVFFSNMDVNDYLDKINGLKNFFDFYAQAFTILFVDPYRFGDVKIVSLNKFLNTYRSELIYNYFISDYRRNINNSYAENKQQMMINSMDGVKGYNRNMNADQVLALLQSNFKTTKIKYTFAYPFHITNNAQLYYIIYGTPHIKGLEKIKKCIWDVFDGNVKHRTKKENPQMTLFTSEFEKESNEHIYSEEAKKRITDEFKGCTKTYQEIEEYVMSSTMLNSSQIIENILKPLIKENKITKCNLKSNRNYKNDSYIF